MGVPECRFVSATNFALNFTKVCEAHNIINFKECCEEVIPCLENKGFFTAKSGGDYDYTTANLCEASLLEYDKCYYWGSDMDGEEDPDFLYMDEGVLRWRNPGYRKEGPLTF